MSLPSAKKRKIFDGRYEVISIVGRGLDSVVYHAKHLSGAQQEVALKVLVNNKPKSSITERLRKEALTLVSCRHKYVVRLDDFHSVADLCYLSMEFAPLGDLRKYLSNSGQPLPVERGTLFLRQALEGMEFVHATGVLHRDLKPDNILVLNESEIRLADFGLALLPGDELNLEELQNGVGSIAYLPPELLAGTSYDSRSDLYSLGVCFYEALSGFHPFENAPLSEQESARLDQNIKPLHEVNPSIPTHVSAVISTLMRHSADHRFQSAMEALRALSNPEFTGLSTPMGSQPPAVSEPFTFDDFTTAEGDSTYAPANMDKADSDFTTNFDDFFNEREEASTPAVTAPLGDKEEPPSRPTENISAKRVKQLLEDDAKMKAAASTHRSQPPPIVTPGSSIDSHQELPTHHHETPLLGAPGITERSARARASGGLTSSLLRINPRISPLLVGVVAAICTVGIVMFSSLRSGDLTPEALNSTGNEEELLGEEALETGAYTDLSHLPSGTYAGNIEGFMPGLITPLALISRPEHNEIVVVIGIDGWSPITISTVQEEGSPSSSVVVRSNGVLLNMTGTTSPEEASGTFSNAITGESGAWSVRKVS